MTQIDLSSINKKYNKIPSNDVPLKSKVPKPKIKEPQVIKEVQPPAPKKAVKTKIPKPDLPKNETQIELSDIERVKKIKVLELYVTEFPDKLEKFKNTNFNKCSNAELIEYKEQFDKSIGTTNNLEWSVSISKQALHLYEMVGRMGGLEINGISKLGDDPNWSKNIKALCLKYLDGGVTLIEPEHQLLFMLFQNTLMLHYLNTSEVAQLPPVQQANQVSEEEKKSNDIVTKLEIQNLNREFEDI